MHIIGDIFHSELLRSLWLHRLDGLLDEDPLVEPDKKNFKLKHALPKLRDYGKKAPHWYWNLFPSNHAESADSKIDADKLEELALKNGYSDRTHLSKVVGWIKNGANIGCSGKYRAPTKARNTDSAVKEGYKISDAIADWVVKGTNLFEFYLARKLLTAYIQAHNVKIFRS